MSIPICGVVVVGAIASAGSALRTEACPEVVVVALDAAADAKAGEPHCEFIARKPGTACSTGTILADCYPLPCATANCRSDCTPVTGDLNEGALSFGYFAAPASCGAAGSTYSVNSCFKNAWGTCICSGTAITTGHSCYRTYDVFVSCGGV